MRPPVPRRERIVIGLERSAIVVEVRASDAATHDAGLFAFVGDQRRDLISHDSQHAQDASGLLIGDDDPLRAVHARKVAVDLLDETVDGLKSVSVTGSLKLFGCHSRTLSGATR